MMEHIERGGRESCQQNRNFPSEGAYDWAEYWRSRDLKVRGRSNAFTRSSP